MLNETDMNVLHLLTAGETGGIESLCRDIGQYGDFENTFCFVTHGGVVCEQMKRQGMRLHCLADIPKKFSLRKMQRLHALAKGQDVIVVHHDDPFLKLYFLMLKATTRKKMVTMVHSCYDEMHFAGYSKAKRAVCDWIFKTSMQCSDAIVYVSEAGKRTHEARFGLLKPKSHIVYNGISPQKLEQGAMHRTIRNTPVNLTYVGRMNRVKGLDTLLRAAALLKNEAILSMVGDGPERAVLEQLAQELALQDRVCFHGQQLDVEPYLRQANVFVYPSTCQEVFGISVVEAMAYGLPCIASKVGGIPEIIQDGTSGLLFPAGDAQALADKIDFLIEHPAQAQALAAEGQKTAQRFSILNTVRRLKEIFQSL